MGEREGKEQEVGWEEGRERGSEEEKKRGMVEGRAGGMREGEGEKWEVDIEIREGLTMGLGRSV